MSIHFLLRSLSMLRMRYKSHNFSMIQPAVLLDRGFFITFKGFFSLYALIFLLFFLCVLFINLFLFVKVTFLKELLLRRQSHDRDEHFLKRDAAMLEGIFVVSDVIVKVIWVGKEIAAGGEDVGRGEIDSRKTEFGRAIDLENLFGLPVEVLA